MDKIVFAILLLVTSILPTSAHKTAWQEDLRGRIDNKTEEVEEIIVDPIPAEIETAQEASVSASAAYFVDSSTGMVLVEKNAEARLPIASITKLMTALIVIENANLADVVTVPALGSHPDDAVMGLYKGEKISVEELLHGLLIVSGSDAALTLASHVSGSENEFVALMNEKVKFIGLTDTQFTNSVGWDESGNYSTAKDLLSISKIALSNPTIAKIVTKKSYVATSVTGRRYLLTNTNKLLGVLGYRGIKTGTTYDAGECLATYYRDSEKEIIGILLGSQSRFTETRSIVEWVDSSFSW